MVRSTGKSQRPLLDQNSVGYAYRDDIDPSKTLQEHQSHSDSHSVASALAEELHELFLLASTVRTAEFDLIADLSHFVTNVIMIWRELA